MLLSAIYKTLGDFVTASINDVGVKIIFSHQNMQRMVKPFITIHINSFRQLDGPNKGAIDNNGIQNITYIKVFTVNLQAYTDNLHGSEELLNVVQNYLPTDFAYSMFKGDMAYMRTLSGVEALPLAVEGNNESRSNLSVEFNTAQSIKIDVGLIEHIEFTDLMTGNEFTVNKI